MNHLIKGVETQFIDQETKNKTKVKILDIINTNPKACVIRDEMTHKRHTLALNDSLASISDDFHGVTIQSIGKKKEGDVIIDNVKTEG